MTASFALAADPLCSSPGADADGDGWGWENNATCIVMTDSSSAATATTNSNADSTSNGRAVCSSATADPDGDGWGWENNGSCIVMADSSSSATTGTNTTANTLGSTTNGPAICSSAAVDQDGDGWGWENNGTCIVVADSSSDSPIAATDPAPAPAALPTPSPAPSPAPVSTPTPETPAITQIMAVGDSITHGTSRGPAVSYRKPFIDLLNANSCRYQMNGSQTGNHFHNTFVSPHEGYNGHTADQILNGHTDDAGRNEGISVMVDRYQPQVVLLHIGSNDMRLGQNINETIGEIDQIISVALAADSAPTVLVANLIPWYSNATVGANVETLGDQIEAYLTQLNNPRVKRVDVRSGYQRSMMLSDGAHPNPTGERHIANRFFAVYNSGGYCQ